MNRKDDVARVLTVAKEQYKALCKDYNKALCNKSLDLRVSVKNLMENLRSALDYMAHDIYISCCQTARLSSGKPEPRTIYFPYGRSETDFKSGVGSSLPELCIHAPNIYNMIASIQPFKCGDNWLYDLCSILNENKHDHLTPQTRLETETDTVINKVGSVTIQVNNPSVNIKSLPGANIKILGVPAQITDKGISTAHSDNLTHERIKWVAFLFEGTNINVLDLLNKAIPGISNFVKKIYKEI